MKHALLVVLVLALTAAAAIAQTEKPAKLASWQLGVTGAPEFTYRVLRPAEGSNYGQDIKRSRDNREEGLTGFTAGLEARHHFSKEVGFFVGLSLSQRRYGATSILITFEGDFDPATGRRPIIDLFANIQNTYTYLGLPLGFAYRSNVDRRLAFTATAGVSLDLLLDAHCKYEAIRDPHYDQGSIRFTDMNTFNLTGIIGAGLEYRAGSRIRLKAEPTFRYGFLPIAPGLVKERLFGAGLQLGLMYRL